MACLAKLVESKNWNEYSEIFFCKSTMMDEKVLLLMLKLLRKARNVPSWHAIRFKSVWKFYFAYNVIAIIEI